MFLYYNQTRIYYKRENQGGKTVLLMHGFGADSKAVDCLFYFLKNRGYDVISLDFPGFGESAEPYEAWSIYDYAECVKYIINTLSLNNVVGLGHSFGGRVGLILASEGYLSALILIDSAGLKPRRNPTYYIKVYAYKIRKFFKLKTDNAGSADYKRLSVNMRASFVKIVNAHLDGILNKIRIPTMILWGKNDKDTPVYMAKKLRKTIKNSILHIMDGGHFSYIDSYNETCMHVENFLCSL
ncbi:MAG: alpha/beta hydrolase [Clostridia bacterium]|nr:alpha/beta hydrolase [Clostridia bacterium]